MAGELIHPFSMYPVTAGRLWSGNYVSSGGVIEEEGMAVEASLGADAIWRCYFDVFRTLPASGTATWVLRVKANASSGVARVNPKWASFAPGEASAGLSLNAEGVTPDAQVGQAGGSGATLTWGTGDADQLLEARWTANADTVVAGERIRMDLTFETASWNLAAVSFWWLTLEWL